MSVACRSSIERLLSGPKQAFRVFTLDTTPLPVCRCLLCAVCSSCTFKLVRLTAKHERRNSR
ncbi:hypothetical protein CZ674_02100 [Agrococcus casei LMG 22410]|uniref:Uncharacterized protein n=1 Tax=Agrococcus casei LMG 22410 TaxID=1255656 RepID=A0A1R4F1S1_9MICO|nr:hypothetical protein CZ674_02100 [Agrococcus casei LMG 22410]